MSSPSAGTRAYCRERGFPTFATVFTHVEVEAEGISVLPHLALLRPWQAAAVSVALQTVTQAAEASPNAKSEILALLADVNWRSHLVAAVALICIPSLANDTMLAALWEAFDCGSWVTPQLAATALMCDPSFTEQAHKRIAAGCPIKMYRWNSLRGTDQSSATESISYGSFSDKALHALVALCRMLPTGPEVLPPLLSEEAISQRLEQDKDHIGLLAVGWHDQIYTLLHGPSIPKSEPLS